MTVLTSNALNETISKSSDFTSVWYDLIKLIGLPVDTEGNVIDSIKAAQAQTSKSPNGIACFTKKSSNYRTNKIWYTLRVY